MSHKHRMKPIAVQPLQQPPKSALALLAAAANGTRTAVLWGCERPGCWHVAATVLLGGWTLEQLLRLPDREPPGELDAAPDHLTRLG